MADTPTIRLADACADHFESFVGQDLTFVNETGESVRLRLEELNRKPARGRGRVPFSLLFVLPEGQDLPGGLLIPQFGNFSPDGWFISRVTLLGGEPGVAYCEAVFA